MTHLTPYSQAEIVDEFDWLAFEAELHSGSPDDNEPSPSLLRSIDSIGDAVPDEEELSAPVVIVPTPAPAPASAPVADDRLAQLVQAASRIGPADLALERELMPLKWHAYAFLTPLAATLEFARRYQDALRNHIRMNVDADLAERVNGIDLDNLLSDRPESRQQLTSLWRARQRADRLGMQYDAYLEMTFAFHAKSWRRFNALPNMLRGSEKSEAAWLRTCPDEWEERLANGIVEIDDHAQFRLEAYEGLPAQLAFRRFVVAMAKEKPSARFFITRHALERASVPLMMFRGIGRDEFGAAVGQMKGDKARGWIKRVDHPNADTVDLRQACYGVPHAQDAASEPCASCPQRGACAAMADAVLAQLKADHGSVNPVADRKRAQTRDRVRALRSRKKAETDAA